MKLPTHVRDKDTLLSGGKTKLTTKVDNFAMMVDYFGTIKSNLASSQTTIGEL
jgi:hypothetical protein